MESKSGLAVAKVRDKERPSAGKRIHSKGWENVSVEPSVELFSVRGNEKALLLYSLYAVGVADAILYAFLVANHSTPSTLERNFGPDL